MMVVMRVRVRLCIGRRQLLMRRLAGTAIRQIESVTEDGQYRLQVLSCAFRAAGQGDDELSLGGQAGYGSS